MTLDLARDTIFVTLAGSHAHGTAREGSDVDLRGVCIAPLEVRVSLFRTFEQFEGILDGPVWAQLKARLEAHPTACRSLDVKTETVIFDIAKFLSLCASANPNALEILFADERDWVLQTPLWLRLHQERRRFLSRKVQQTYLGYAMAQLKKIRTHRSWLLNPPGHKPTRAEFGLPDSGTMSRDDQNRIEQSIADRIRSWGIDSLEMPKSVRIAVQDRMQSFWCDSLGAKDDELDDKLRAVAISALQLPAGVVDALNAERKYRTAMRHWEAYETWKSERNPVRAELEREHGYDTKHAMHLLRLMQTGLELLETGELRVRRPDASELAAVRNGKLTYEELLARAADLEARMDAAAGSTRLPAQIDFGFVDELALGLIRHQNQERHG
ncbi:MAG: nucleotidyltransferase domain-containing protein [Deltaproteobacteria bacterium]|nr:nucleotidyltransferase domain-containing protein [Deltaproteobacteria bacterium]